MKTSKRNHPPYKAMPLFTPDVEPSDHNPGSWLTWETIDGAQVMVHSRRTAHHRGIFIEETGSGVTVGTYRVINDATISTQVHRHERSALVNGTQRIAFYQMGFRFLSAGYSEN